MDNIIGQSDKFGSICTSFEGRLLVARDIRIRKFEEKEAAFLYRMVQDAIDISYRKVYPPEAVDYFKEHHSMGDILSDASLGYTVVADCSGEMLGTGTLLDTNVRRVYINPLHRYKGIGKLIVAELERRALDEMIVSLDLSASLVSKRFWESCGFMVQSEDSLPVGNNQKLHYYTMVKVLNIK